MHLADAFIQKYSARNMHNMHVQCIQAIIFF